MQIHRSTTRIGRRAMVTGAAASTIALASTPAPAQRCPATPPARTKGPPVRMDLDQHELDEAYDQSVYAFNSYQRGCGTWMRSEHQVGRK